MYNYLSPRSITTIVIAQFSSGRDLLEGKKCNTWSWTTRKLQHFRLTINKLCGTVIYKLPKAIDHSCITTIKHKQYANRLDGNTGPTQLILMTIWNQKRKNIVIRCQSVNIVLLFSIITTYYHFFKINKWTDRQAKLMSITTNASCS